MFHNYHGSTPTPPTRTFEDYRYAIEAGLISPHDVRCYVPAWELSPTDATPPAGTRARPGKRYHESSDDDEMDESDKENHGIGRCALRRLPTPSFLVFPRAASVRNRNRPRPLPPPFADTHAPFPIPRDDAGTVSDDSGGS